VPKLVYDTLIFLGPISNVEIINFVPSTANAEITLAITFEQASAAREAFSHRTFEIPPLLRYQKTCLTFCRTRPGTRNTIRPLSRTHPPRSRTSYLWKPSHLQKPNLALSNSGKTAQSSCHSDSCPKDNRQTVLKAMYNAAMSRLTCSSAVQEVKECYQDLITHAANLFKSDLGNSLPVITQRLDNKITKCRSL
jgi:hypothetical protein